MFAKACIIQPANSQQSHKIFHNLEICPLALEVHCFPLTSSDNPAYSYMPTLARKDALLSEICRFAADYLRELFTVVI